MSGPTNVPSFILTYVDGNKFRIDVNALPSRLRAFAKTFINPNFICNSESNMCTDATREWLTTFLSPGSRGFREGHFCTQ